MPFFLFVFSLLFLPTEVKALDSYADIVEELMPSVVNISTEKMPATNDEDTLNTMVNTTFQEREALGSGFFIKKEGYILTNAHIIEGAKTINIITNDDKVYKAKLIGKDKISDLAVLKIDQDKKSNISFKPVIFGNADDVRIGDIVLAFGNPYGLGISVSQGIISAKSRNIGLNEQPYLQTDAAINEGNSGGPLFNLDGQVIGINTAIFKSDNSSGIGFSLPANMANWVSTQLINNGKVRRGWIGMTIGKGIDRVTEQPGLIITEIDENSNAYKNGIRAGDLILSYNDIKVKKVDDFLRFTEKMNIGQVLRLEISSYGEIIKKTITVQEIPSENLKRLTNQALIENHRFYHSDIDSDVVYISELSIAVKEAKPRGLLIVKIDRKSPLFYKGIEIGDIILEADRSDIYSADNLIDSLKTSSLNDFRPISLLIQGVNNTYYTDIKIEAEND